MALSRSALPAATMLLTALAIAPQGAWAQMTQQQMDDNARRLQQNDPSEERLRMNDNARRMEQNDPSGQLNSPTGQRPAPGQGTTSRASPQSGGQALEAARQTWLKRPPLPPDRNPLLGRWRRPPTGQGNSSDPFAGLQALAKGGLCEVLFGGGTFEFRTTTLVGFDVRTSEQELDKVEYRGDAKHVVVLPKTTLKLIEFDFDGPNRINWTSQNCVLVRVGTASSSASGATPPAAGAGATPTQSTRSSANSGGVLAMSVGMPSADNKVAGRKLMVLKEDAQVALIKGGLQSTPDGTVLQNWMRACFNRAPACEKGARALLTYTVGIATTDANGRAQTPTLPAGRYWVLSDTKIGNKRMMWNEPVDLKGGDQSVILDHRNAMPVE
jgi:hypothetical protein